MVRVEVGHLVESCGNRVEFREVVVPLGAVSWAEVKERGFRARLLSRVVEEAGACYVASLRVESLARRRLSKSEMRNGAVTEKVARALVVVPLSR